jgi:hypothetical protein
MQRNHAATIKRLREEEEEEEEKKRMEEKGFTVVKNAPPSTP